MTANPAPLRAGRTATAGHGIMRALDHVELTLPLVLIAIAALSVLARLLRVPYPILMVLGGLALGVVPGAPRVELDPELVLVVFLPPLLYVGAFFVSLRDVRRDARTISLLAVGLVLATATAVALVAHELVGLSWAAAFTLGAIVSPTDPLAATQIMGRLGAPRRISTVLEGEGLINDGTALVLYRAAVGAAVGGTFSAWEAGLQLVVAPVGGVVVGLVVGWIVAQVRLRLEDTPTEITISLLTGYAAFVPAEALGLSGVIAAVTAGVYLGWRAPELASSETRLQGFSFWTIVQFLLNAALFVLIGLQLPVVLDALEGQRALDLLWWSAAVSLVVMAVRMGWVFAMTAVIRTLDRRPVQRERRAPWRARVVSGWAGMRGAVSLAAALAIPVQTDAGDPFPGRDLIILLTFAVILVTLVLQGSTMPLLIRVLGVTDDGGDEREELKARLVTAKAALARLEELEAEDWVREDTLARMRRFYEWRKRRFAARTGRVEDLGYDDQSAAYQRMVREVIEAQRRALVRLRNDGAVSSDVMHRIERELDLEDSRLEGEPRGGLRLEREA